MTPGCSRESAGGTARVPESCTRGRGASSSTPSFGPEWDPPTRRTSSAKPGCGPWSGFAASSGELLAETRRTAAEALQKQVAEAERALGEALKAAAPDAATVGAALLKVEGLRRQFAPIEEAFRTGVAAILTADQKTKLDTIRSVAAAVQAGEALRRTGLL